MAPHLANLGTRYTLGEFQAVLGLAQRSAAALGQDETTYPSLLQEVRSMVQKRCRVGTLTSIRALGGWGRILLQHLDTLTRTLGTR